MIAFPDIPKPSRCVTETSTFGNLTTPAGRIAAGVRQPAKHIPDAPVEVLIAFTPTGQATESVMMFLPPAYVYGLAGLLADVIEQAVHDGALLPRDAAALAAAQAAAAERLAAERAVAARRLAEETRGDLARGDTADAAGDAS